MNNEFITLYPGIELCYQTFSSDSFSAQHKTMAHMIQINYCKAGQLIWEMENGNRIYLNPGDFSLHTIKVCADSVLTFPGNMYQGLTICIDLQEASGNPPELLKDNNIFETVFPEKFCRNDTPVFLPEMNRRKVFFPHFITSPKS